MNYFEFYKLTAVSSNLIVNLGDDNRFEGIWFPNVLH
jgi:hypothetical protein